MKIQNSNLLMTVAAIDLTETEMEAIVGGQYSIADYDKLWITYKPGLLQNDQATKNTVYNLCLAEQKLQTTSPAEFAQDKANFLKWMATQPKNDQVMITSLGKQFGFIK